MTRFSFLILPFLGILKGVKLKANNTYIYWAHRYLYKITYADPEYQHPKYWCWSNWVFNTSTPEEFKKRIKDLEKEEKRFISKNFIYKKIELES